MKKLLIVGGKQRADYTEEWNGFECGIMAELDTPTGRLTVVNQYTSPPETMPNIPAAILFKAATVLGDKLYACTQTEVVVYSLPSYQQLLHVSVPCLNDVHHVCPTPSGTLLVANTGLDMVVELSEKGETLREWDVLGEPLWSRFSRETDYRKVLTTKPHQSHPNFVFLLGEEVWVTRFKQLDAICLTKPGRSIHIGVERPHDGVLAFGKIYFTTVNGFVVVVDQQTLEVTETYNLGEFQSAWRYLGWCRAISVVEPHLVVVGFSRIRPTVHLDNLLWLKSQEPLNLKSYGVQPSRVALFDLQRRRVLWERNCESVGLNAIFSIHVLE
jgi:hypothetical protein